MTGDRILLDEHVGRIFDRLLYERGYDVVQAKDQFGEHTNDVELLQWCADETVILLTNNAKDFEPLHRTHDHAGMLLYYDQTLPDNDPEGLARTVDEVFILIALVSCRCSTGTGGGDHRQPVRAISINQYGSAGIENELVNLDEWYDWLHE